MKLSYTMQMMITVIVLFLTNVISTILKYWIYAGAGFVICGLLWVIHPALPNGSEVTKRALLRLRIIGIVFILYGVYTGARIY